MINVLIDGNYIFHKTLGVFGGWGSKNPAEILGSESDQSMFIRKISTDLCSSLRSIPTGGRLIFTADSRSWRKDVPIEGGGYKANRIKDEEVDWSIFFNLLHSFGNHLEKMGFIYSKSEGAEGDDLLYFWSDYFTTKGENCIVVSADKDLHQLARWNKSNWTLVWSNNSKNNVLTTPIGWKEKWLDTVDEPTIFSMESLIDPDKDKLRSLIKKADIQEVDPKYYIFNKMLVGDKGDNVPSAWEMEKSGKIHRITPKKADQIMESFLDSQWSADGFDSLIEDDDFLEFISKLILRLMQDVDNKENRDKAKKNLLLNYKLMWLDKKVIPMSVISGVISEIRRGINLEKKSITLDRIKILEGTNWVTTQSVPKHFDPFNSF